MKPVKSKHGKGKEGLSEDIQPLYPRTENDDSTLISEALVKITSGECEELSDPDVEDFKCHQCSFVGSNKTMLQDHRKK